MTTKITSPVDPEVSSAKGDPGGATQMATAGAKAAKDQASAVAGTAQDQAGEVLSTVGEQASTVAGTAKEQGGQVVANAGQQARALLDQTYQQISAQAEEQGARLADNLRALSGEFSRMAGAGDSGSPASSALDILTHSTSRAADYLDDQQPGQLFGDVSGFARRRPGSFLLGAVAAGFVVGRITKAARSDAPDRQLPPESDPYPSDVPASGTARDAVS